MLEQTRENKKFTYAEVARNARAREYSESIQWLVDAGLVVKVSQRVIVKGSTLFSEFNGAFVENYAAQELVANGQKDLYYWTSKHQAEVDFIIAIDDQVLPLEVKAGVSKQKKSLRVYGDKYKPHILSCSTLTNFKGDGAIRNYPLYALCRFLSRHQPSPESSADRSDNLL